MDIDTLKLFEGGLGIDDRGQVLFVNGFDFQDVRRFYVVENHEAGFVRAWHGHQNEAKYVFVSRGEAIVAAVQIDNWDSPSKELPIQRFVLSAKKPMILAIPAGFANGFKTLTPDAQVFFFATSTLEESKTDDFRYPFDYWNPWEVVSR